ncbi:MAG: hypothetical protein QNK40_11560 [Desulfobacterales bacterium]|nr:hypothetical protein [Desulfobacterales bacterium]
MEDNTIINPPNRITDVVNLKKRGDDLDIHLSFDIVPVNFAHKNYEFQAYIFLCRFSGTINNTAFTFRKCYAKGCPNNLCPHVSQAVMIANRYLKRDYKRLLDAGIPVEENFFSLEEMMVKYEGVDIEKNESTGGILTIHDYINIAKEGNPVEIQINLESIPAVEHFVNQKNEQTFLMADFNIITLGRNSQFQRCLACFETLEKPEERSIAITTANDRLTLLYKEFNDAKVTHKACFFN